VLTYRNYAVAPRVHLSLVSNLNSTVLMNGSADDSHFLW